jgi:hypothetical protein
MERRNTWQAATASSGKATRIDKLMYAHKFLQKAKQGVPPRDARFDYTPAAATLPDSAAGGL